MVVAGLSATHHGTAQNTALTAGSTSGSSQGLIPVQGDESQDSSQSTQPTSSAPPPATTPGLQQVYEPSGVCPFDRDKFMADSDQILAGYAQVTTLLTFNASMTDDMKADRIEQAKTASDKALSQVGNLALDLGSDPGAHSAYQQADKTAIDGAAEISASVDALNNWVSSRTDTVAYSNALDGVTAGAQQLVQFSDELAGP